MRVVHINNHSKVIGGSETVMYGEIKELLKRDIDVLTLTIGSNFSFSKSKLELYPPIGGYSIFSFFNLLISLIWLMYTKPDIAHLHIYYGRLTNSIILALKLLKIPIVQSVHEYRMLCPNYTFLDNQNTVCELCQSESRYSLLRKKCAGSFLKSLSIYIETYFRDIFVNPKIHIDYFIFVSDFISRIHKKYLGNFNSSVIWNFTEEYPAATKEEYQYDLIYVGRLSREKGLFTLLDALPKNTSIAIIGSGQLEENLKQKYSTEGIHFLGRIAHDKIKDYVSRSKFLVIPSIWYENNPMTIIESYSCGTPIIGSNIGGIPEILIDKKTGFLFSKGDVSNLNEIISSSLSLSSQDYLKMRTAALDFYNRELTPQIHIEKVLTVYKNLIKLKKQ